MRRRLIQATGTVEFNPVGDWWFSYIHDGLRVSIDEGDGTAVYAFHLPQDEAEELFGVLRKQREGIVDL